MADEVNDRDEQVIEVNGQEYVRTRVTARLKVVDEKAIASTVQEKNKAVASSLYWQDGTNPDLVWTQFILDMEGDNKNWDYMPRPSLMNCHATAKYKPFDMEHIIKEESSMMWMDKDKPPVKNTIFGVMTHASLADRDGRLLTPDEIKALAADDNPFREDKERITVVGWAGLWNYLFPETVGDVLEHAEAGYMSVSMERWISKYDFMVRDGEKSYKTVTRAEAKENGIMDKWTKREMVNGYPVLRRSLAFTYGGVASTINPAQKAAKFLTQSELKAAASMTTVSPMLQKMLDRHSEVHVQFALSTDDTQKQALIAEHRWLHQCLSEV